MAGKAMRARPRVRVEKAADFKRIYATGAYGMHSPWDFRIGFYREDMEVREETLLGQEPPTLKREILVEVVLTPPAAKALAQQLMKGIQEYEARYGKIPLPPRPEGKPGGSGLFV